MMTRSKSVKWAVRRRKTRKRRTGKSSNASCGWRALERRQQS
jgi:hypothetical protein